MIGLWFLLFFALGAVLGSFMNVVADRLPAGESIISPPSHCPGCGRRLSAADNIPVFSYLWLRGRCRYCGAGIPARLFWVELGMGLLFLFLFWRYGLGWQTAIISFYCCLFAVLSIIDLERRILPDKIVYPGMVVALVLAAIAGPGLVSVALGGAIAFGLFLVLALVFKGGMGGGDIKLAGLVGLATGFPLVCVALFLAVVSGGIIAGALLLLKLKGRKDPIPFGPFLCLAALATLFWGPDIVHLFGFA